MIQFVDRIVDYEEGALDFDETVALFQELLDSGIIFRLQGSYQRQLHQFVEAGLVQVREVKCGS